MNDDELRAALDALADQNGRITPTGVVEAARAEEHPLHGEFNWDDATAAHQHRLEQARALIRRVPVYNRVVHRGMVRVPCYVRDPQAQRQEQGYVALGAVARASAEARQVVTGEMARVRGALERAQAVAEHLDVQGIAQRLEQLLATAAEIQAQLLRRDAA